MDIRGPPVLTLPQLRVNLGPILDTAQGVIMYIVGNSVSLPTIIVNFPSVEYGWQDNRVSGVTEVLARAMEEAVNLKDG